MKNFQKNPLKIKISEIFKNQKKIQNFKFSKMKIEHLGASESDDDKSGEWGSDDEDWSSDSSSDDSDQFSDIEDTGANDDNIFAR